MIDEKKLIEHIEKQYREWGEEYDAMQIIGDIEDFPKVDGWIPVEERLPKHCQVVLTSKDGCISIEQFDIRSLCWVERERNRWWMLTMVDAWMPLPEPYVKGEDEQ